MMPSPRPNGFPSPAVGILALVLLATALFAIRLAAPPDLRDNGQEHLAAHVTDFLRNEHWVVQFDQTGSMMSKPPLTTWLTALPALPFEKLNLLLLSLPSFLSVLAAALVLHAAGSRRLSPLAGFLGATLFLCSMVALKQIALARTDPLFSVLVFVASLLAFRAWNDQRSWIPFWLVAAAATLTKGPLGVVLALGGLLAFLTVRPIRNPLRGPHFAGILLFLGLTVGWLVAAYLAEGRIVADKIIGRELVGHAVRMSSHGFEWDQLAKPFLYFLGRFAPWSLLTFVGVLLAFRRPSEEVDPSTVRFRRFLACSLLFGLLLFSLSSHQRPDHLVPLVPAAALLAGDALARLVGLWPRRLLRRALAVLVVVFLGSVALWAFFIRPKAEVVQQTLALRQIAAEIRETYGPDFEPEFVLAPYTLQFYLGTMRQEFRPEIAADECEKGRPILILTNHPQAIEEHMLSWIKLHRLREWQLPGEDNLWLVSNRPPSDEGS